MLNQEKIYEEASNWVRSANNLIWQVGAIFIPLSIGAFVYATEYPQHKLWLCFGSIFLWFIWVYMAILYGNAVTPCRKALEDIEQKCKVDPAQQFYRKHGSLFSRWWGSRNMLAFFTFIFIIAWASLILGCTQTA